VRSSSRYTFGPNLSAQERARALELPAGFDPKTRALAADWRAAHPDDIGVVRAALDLFHASFRYTLRPPLLGRDSIDDFLFSTRQGFCEHYASAFVVLMRSAGIPARVVTGYQGGWWNDSGGYLLVRNSDAHAWAEVWMAGRGWVRVDPTAAVSPARIELGAAAASDASSWEQTSWVRALRNNFDRVNCWWTQTVIRFDAPGVRPTCFNDPDAICISSASRFAAGAAAGSFSAEIVIDDVMRSAKT
jgi:transglutaminase-like putative cysteine protease